MENRNPIQILEERLDGLAEYLNNFSPLGKLIEEANPYVQNSGRYAQFLQNPDYFDHEGRVKMQYALQLHNLRESAKKPGILEVLWKVNTMQEAISLLGIAKEISEDQKEIREYLNFLKMYIDTAMSDPPVYVLSSDDLNTEIKNKAIIQLIDNKRKILPLFETAKQKLKEYAQICNFKTAKQIFKRRTLEGELRRSVERLLNSELDEEQNGVEVRVFNQEEMAIYLALRISEDYYEREILPKLRPVK